MTGLRIAPKLTLPLEVAGEAIALLGKRGSGKTNTGRVLAEELHAQGVQIVVLDPVGAWWGLRASADGKKGGIAVPILGGAHGDVPLEPTAGRLLADVVVDSGQPLVIDLSDFSKTQQRQFVVEFAEHLYQRKARQPSLMHLFLEEADEFAPQNVTAAAARMVGAIEQLVRRGRGRGIGLTMITQRSASLNKGVLEQTDVLLAMRTTGPRDRNAVNAWVDKQDVEGAELVLPSLSSLATGEAWVWNPERDLLARVRIRVATTYDSSATPKAGQKRARSGPALAAIDLHELGREIAATAEKAKASDPRQLQARVRELERELAQALHAGDTARQEAHRLQELVVDLQQQQRKAELVEVPVLTDEMMERLVKSVAPAADALVAIKDFVHEFGEISHAIAASANTTIKEATVARAHAIGAPPAAAGVSRPAPAPRREPQPAARPAAVATSAGGAVSGPQQRILNALAWFEAIGVQTPRRSPLAAVAGASPKSSGFEKNVSTLRALGLVDYPERGRLALTDAGRAGAQPPAVIPSEADLHEAVCRMVSGPQASILRVLIAVWPNALSRGELAERAGVSAASSGFEKNISTLRSFELVDYPSRGEVVALPLLFPGR